MFGRDEHKSREADKAAQAELNRRIEERNQYFQLITAKRTGSSAQDMPPLVCDPADQRKAVFLITIPITFGRFELSKNSYKLLARHVGMTMDSVSHWAIAVIDRGLSPCFFYELMSDDLALNALGKSQFRFDDVTAEFIETWKSCYYVGETVKTHEQIQHLGEWPSHPLYCRFSYQLLSLGAEHLVLHPRYNLLNSNCQDMVEILVKQLCEGSTISQGKLKEELAAISPKIALDLMVARFRSRVDTFGEHEDPEKVKDHDEVQKDAAMIDVLWDRVRKRTGSPKPSLPPR